MVSFPIKFTFRGLFCLFLFAFVLSHTGNARDSTSIKILRINAEANSYAPFYDFHSGQMYWTRRATDNGEDFFDIQLFSKIDSNNFHIIENPQVFEIEGLPSEITSIGNVKLSGDGKSLVFSTTLIEDDTTWHIYYAEKEEDRWTIQEEIIECGSWTGHPCISKDKSTIYFSSVNPDSKSKNYGRADIYYVKRIEDDKWSEPENIGAAVNSEYEELSPFINESAEAVELFFASDRPGSIGGLDIYKTIYDKNSRQWALPEPLEHLNTEFDEAFYSTPFDTVKENADFFASTRDDNQWQLYGIWKKLRVVKQIFLAAGTVLNARTKEALINAEVVIREIRRDTSAAPFIDKILKDTTGKYNVVELEKDREFEITANSNDIFYDSFRIIISDKDTLMVIKPDTAAKFAVELEKDREFEITAQSGDLFYDSFTIKIARDDTTEIINFFFNVSEKLTLRINFPLNKYTNPYQYTLDSNGIETGLTWQRVMDILKENILLTKDKIKKLTLVGHTDDIGTDEFNNRLGKNRLNFIISELVKRGTPREMLNGRSAVELEPLPPKAGENIETYRKRLRRVELRKVLKKSE